MSIVGPKDQRSQVKSCPRNQHSRQGGPIPTAGGSQHLPKISDDLEEPLPRRDHDLLEEPPERLARGVAERLVLVVERGREPLRILLEDLCHVRVQRRQGRRRRPGRDQGRQLGSAGVELQELALATRQT